MWGKANKMLAFWSSLPHRSVFQPLTELKTVFILCSKLEKLCSSDSSVTSKVPRVGFSPLCSSVTLSNVQPSTNGDFVVLHEKQDQGDACDFFWSLMRSKDFCLFRLVCLLKGCQSKWRGGTDVRPGVMQEGNHVESGLANGKWVSLSWLWHHYSARRAFMLNHHRIISQKPIAQSGQIKQAQVAAIAFIY